MSLPFLKDKSERRSSQPIANLHYSPPTPPMPPQDEALMSAAADILDAVETRNLRNLTEALRAAFQIMDAEPHLEGEHLNEENE